MRWSRSSGRPRWAAWHNDITDRVIPLASPSARWLTRQIIKATSGWRNCPSVIIRAGEHH
jgi:hypothetical protein